MVSGVSVYCLFQQPNDCPPISGFRNLLILSPCPLVSRCTGLLGHGSLAVRQKGAGGRVPGRLSQLGLCLPVFSLERGSRRHAVEVTSHWEVTPLECARRGCACGLWPPADAPPPVKLRGSSSPRRSAPRPRSLRVGFAFSFCTPQVLAGQPWARHLTSLASFLIPSAMTWNQIVPEVSVL